MKHYIVGDWVAVEKDGGRYVGRIKQINGNRFMVVFGPGDNWRPIIRAQVSPCVVVPTL